MRHLLGVCGIKEGDMLNLENGERNKGSNDRDKKYAREKTH